MEVLLNVDHHLSNDMYGNENYVDTNAAATAEIVYELLLELGYYFKEDDEICKEIGTCIIYIISYRYRMLSDILMLHIELIEIAART